MGKYSSRVYVATQDGQRIPYIRTRKRYWSRIYRVIILTSLSIISVAVTFWLLRGHLIAQHREGIDTDNMKREYHVLTTTPYLEEESLVDIRNIFEESDPLSLVVTSDAPKESFSSKYHSAPQLILGIEGLNFPEADLVVDGQEVSQVFSGVDPSSRESPQEVLVSGKVEVAQYLTTESGKHIEPVFVENVIQQPKTSTKNRNRKDSHGSINYAVPEHPSGNGIEVNKILDSGFRVAHSHSEDSLFDVDTFKVMEVQPILDFSGNRQRVINRKDSGFQSSSSKGNNDSSLGNRELKLTRPDFVYKSEHCHVIRNDSEFCDDMLVLCLLISILRFGAFCVKTILSTCKNILSFILVVISSPLSWLRTVIDTLCSETMKNSILVPSSDVPVETFIVKQTDDLAVVNLPQGSTESTSSKTDTDFSITMTECAPVNKPSVEHHPNQLEENRFTVRRITRRFSDEGGMSMDSIRSRRTVTTSVDNPLDNESQISAIERQSPRTVEKSKLLPYMEDSIISSGGVSNSFLGSESDNSSFYMGILDDDLYGSDDMTSRNNQVVYGTPDLRDIRGIHAITIPVVEQPNIDNTGMTSESSITIDGFISSDSGTEKTVDRQRIRSARNSYTSHYGTPFLTPHLNGTLSISRDIDSGDTEVIEYPLKSFTDEESISLIIPDAKPSPTTLRAKNHLNASLSNESGARRGTEERPREASLEKTGGYLKRNSTQEKRGNESVNINDRIEEDEKSNPLSKVSNPFRSNDLLKTKKSSYKQLRESAPLIEDTGSNQMKPTFVQSKPQILQQIRHGRNTMFQSNQQGIRYSDERRNNASQNSYSRMNIDATLYKRRSDDAPPKNKQPNAKLSL